MSAPDLDERRRIRRGRRRFLLLVMAAALALAVVGAAVFAWLGGYDSDVWDGERPAWAAVLGLIFVGLGLLTGIGVLVHVVRSGRYRANRDSRLWALSWSRRRELLRTVRRGGAVGDDLPLLRHTAEQMAGQRWLGILGAGLVLNALGQALVQFSPIWLAFFLVMVSLVAVAVVLTVRDARRGEAFLRAHPIPRKDAQDRTASGM